MRTKSFILKRLFTDLAERVIEFIEINQFDCSWNIYSKDTWIVKDKSDPRIVREENIVQAKAIAGTIDILSDNADVGKILCMCNPDSILDIEQKLKEKFSSLSIVKSSNILLEIMQDGVTKGNAVKELCEMWDISLSNTIAFGDHYNDVEMLETVAMPFLMGNAPEELKSRFPNVTENNDEEGIYNGLAKIGLIPKILNNNSGLPGLPSMNLPLRQFRQREVIYSLNLFKRQKGGFSCSQIPAIMGYIVICGPVRPRKKSMR